MSDSDVRKGGADMMGKLRIEVTSDIPELLGAGIRAAVSAFGEKIDAAMLESGHTEYVIRERALSEPRRFYMERIMDETGVSSTGRVIEGVLFVTGQAVIQWRPPTTSTCIYPDLETFLKLHVLLHPSKNRVVWLDEIPPNVTMRQRYVCQHGKEPAADG